MEVIVDDKTPTDVAEVGKRWTILPSCASEVGVNVHSRRIGLPVKKS